MKVALIGITGRVGSRLAAELLKRGHAVTGIARAVDKVEARAGLVVKPGDATAASMLARLSLTFVRSSHDGIFRLLLTETWSHHLPSTRSIECNTLTWPCL